MSQKSKRPHWLECSSLSTRKQVLTLTMALLKSSKANHINPPIVDFYWRINYKE